MMCRCLHAHLPRLVAHGAKHLVLIDSISPRRAPTAGRPDEAEQMSSAEWKGFIDRFRSIAKLGDEEFGLTVSLHPHAAGFMDFEPEIERLLGEIDVSILKICLDTGHTHYAGFDPVAFMKRHMERIAYVHFKDIDPVVRAKAVANRTRLLRGLRPGHLLQPGQGHDGFQGRASVACSTRLSRLVHGRAGLRPGRCHLTGG